VRGSGEEVSLPNLRTRPIKKGQIKKSRRLCLQLQSFR
jgi:hypothetical protein